MGQKYAVLISGDLAETGYDEFWNDVVLMREALIDNDFPANHVYVLYGDGSDYFDAGRTNPQYRPSPAITDLAATSANITAVFNGLANGFHIAAINAGRHVSPCFAGDTIYAASEVIAKEKIEGRQDIGALRLKTYACKNAPCHHIPPHNDAGSLADGVLLELDYWLIMPI